MPFGAFVQVGEGIEGLVHISEMAVHHVEAPEQVVTPGEELWVKIIDIDLDRRRISLSIKQAAEGGVVAAEYQEHFGEHAYDEQGNYIGPAFEESRGRGRGRGEAPSRKLRGDAEADAAPSPAAEPPTTRRTEACASSEAATRRAAGRRHADGVAGSGRSPGSRMTSDSRRPECGPTIQGPERIPRGVAVSNRRTLMAAAAIVLARRGRHRCVHVRIRTPTSAPQENAGVRRRLRREQ